MADQSLPPSSNIEGSSSEPLLPVHGAARRQESRRFVISVFLGVVSLLCFICYFGTQSRSPLLPPCNRKSSNPRDLNSVPLRPVSRGKRAGVSEKASQVWRTSPCQWTNEMLDWQRTAYHFQPQNNWMNDPNGPMFYNGWYHLFYQYNPDSAVWGNITWGHTVSKDLIHWLYLDLAMVPDQWYDLNGVWTGSATILPDGNIIMLYTGATSQMVQVQNLALPANLSDPLLRDWIKYEGNPVLVPPKGIYYKDFRDPTTAWKGPDGTWLLAIGSKVDTTGIALVYQTEDFLNYTLLEGVMHAVPETGMWECVDLYPVSTTDTAGLDNSVSGTDDVKFVLKASLDDLKKDFYALGSYDPATNTWTPDDPEIDVGIGMRYDYGKYYASKTFYDQNNNRRVLWGWIGETDSEQTDMQKGWASVQTLPRVVYLDPKTKSNLIQWPVEEVESLRTSAQSFDSITVAAGSVMPLNITPATQLDINIDIEFPGFENILEADVNYNCSTSGGAADRGVLGPFGLLVLAKENLEEKTAVFFYVSRSYNGDYKTHFCHDDSKSSKATDLIGYTYGDVVPVISGEKLSLRILVDHSIIESYAQGGRLCITSRVYPTEAIYGAARVFLFNNASVPITTTRLDIWHMDSAHIQPFVS